MRAIFNETTSGDSMFLHYSFGWLLGCQQKYIAELGGIFVLQRSAQQIEKVLSILTICLIPVHLLGSGINASNSIDKGYGHSYPFETYILIGLYLLVIIAVDLHILVRRGFVHLRGYTCYWKISSIIILLSLIGLATLDTYTIGPIIALPLMATPYGMLFPVVELFFFENSSINMCFIVLLFCLLNWSLCILIKQFFQRK